MVDIIRVVDFETTDNLDDCEPIELGWADIRGRYTKDGMFEIESIEDWHNIMICPSRPISIGAMAVHHISQADAEAGVKDKSWVDVALRVDPGDNLVAFVAHNHTTELDIFTRFAEGKLDHIKWICTYRVSCILYPDLEKHSNQFLRYGINGGLKFDQSKGLPTHRGGPDSYVTAFIAQEMLKFLPLELMMEITKRELPLNPTMPIGKIHKGKYWADIPLDYFEWIQRQTDFTASVVYGMNEELKRRRGEPSDFDFYDKVLKYRFPEGIPPDIEKTFRRIGPNPEPEQDTTPAQAEPGPLHALPSVTSTSLRFGQARFGRSASSGSGSSSAPSPILPPPLVPSAPLTPAELAASTPPPSPAGVPILDTPPIPEIMPVSEIPSVVEVARAQNIVPRQPVRGLRFIQSGQVKIRSA